MEKVVNEEKPGKHEEKEEKNQGNESTTGGNKKKSKNVIFSCIAVILVMLKWGSAS